MSPRTKNPWVSVGVALMIAISLNSMSYTWAQTSTSNTTVSSDSDEASSPDTFLQRPIDKAMDPLYKMTNYFLQLVKGNTGITEYVDELERSGLEVVKRDNQTDYFATLQSSAFMLRLSTEWGQTVQWFIAYTVCIAVGILFMIIMPIVGCCVCCCRCCCKKCGGKVDPMEPKNAKCRRVVFGLVLAVITTLMLGGMVCAFVTNELMQEQTNHNNNDTGLLNSISKEIGRIDDYLSNTLTEINTTVINSYNGAKGSVIRKIEDAADTALDKIGTATNASEVIDKAKELAKSVNTLAANLETVKTDTEALSDLTIQLDGELAAVRQNISDTLSSCTVVATCNATGSQLDSLQTGANFTSLTTDALKTITDALEEVEKVQNNNISAKVEQGEQEYKNISVKAKEQLDNEINKTKVELKKLDEKLGATLVDLSAQTKVII
ncbi:prominin-1-like [Lingula anatina]|uniref:Prominin-1-like n=1 Tax=Lingula anatina TaxID=7574 RepID=A0A2R2MIY1_LINAN|nr:prominin-1-like [Lingula anatina]|eukprot:XP_023930163.1 prominin-1-like [Lingula anatina]